MGKLEGRIAGRKLQGAGCKSQVAGRKLQQGFRLQVSYTAACSLQPATCSLQHFILLPQSKITLLVIVNGQRQFCYSAYPEKSCCSGAEVCAHVGVGAREKAALPRSFQ